MPKIDKNKIATSPGKPYPFGPVVGDGGIRFSVFSRHATHVWLAFYENESDTAPKVEIALDYNFHRVGDVWSVEVKGVEEGTLYKYRMDGPHEPERGHRYDPKAYLLDPYAKAFVGDVHDGTMKCVAIRDDIAWREDLRPHVPMRDTVIYETHVRGFTRDATSGVEHPGTYRGLIEKIPYLKDLGVTTIELLPLQEFGENLVGRKNPMTGEELTNYWGYSSIGFFAPTGRYAVSNHGWDHVSEFREMIHACHEAGLEVILDVVFNHTSEGNEHGPTLSFRGIDNTIYYILDDDGHYMNYSGCGNTVNCNHPLVRDFILDCLRYWVAVMHVDGFRFDLASILGRDQKGNVLENPPLIERIAEDPVLRDANLIAEAWDAGGAYQVGSFGNGRWAEWNGRYRDDVRRYWRGDGHLRAAFASRVSGSSDLYESDGRTPESSVNFITSHDGFTLRDLVSYEHKHNQANGEENRDGSNDDHSMNFGVEGETDDPEINAVRLRMQKNYLATLFLSLGVPMLHGGDEFGRTQQGNNNAYCQDNEISWYDWSLAEKNQELLRFTKEVIAFRKAHSVFRRNRFFNGIGEGKKPEAADVIWYVPEGTEIDWKDEESPLAWRLKGEEGESFLYIAANPSEETVAFPLPKGAWERRIDTAQTGPDDILAPDTPGDRHEKSIEVQQRSLVVLASKGTSGSK